MIQQGRKQRRKSSVHPSSLGGSALKGRIDLSVTDRFADLLVSAGMSREAAAQKTRLGAMAVAALDGAPISAWFVPGRIEFLGKHTDYAGGRSLLCAMESGFCMVGRPRTDGIVRVIDAATEEEACFPRPPGAARQTGHWSDYPMTVAERVAQNFPGEYGGADLAFASDLPPAAGLSSSSAFIVATFLALSDLYELPRHLAYQQWIQTTEDLCGYLGTIENGQTFSGLIGGKGVGTFGGGGDHTAIIGSESGRLMQYSFASVRKEASVALPAGYRFIIAASGVIAEKTGSAQHKYNRLSIAVGAILEIWRRTTGEHMTSLAAGLQMRPAVVEKMRSLLASTAVKGFSAEELVNRFDQFVHESERIIPAAAAALASGQLTEMGHLVDESQRWSERGLGNQVPETIFLVTEARRRGAVAASAFGAGFGGSVWALVSAEAAGSFATEWSAAYAPRFPEAAQRARFFQTGAGPAATRLL